LLGIKVIKLNKIKGTQTIGANLLATQNLARAILQSSKLQSTGSNPNQSNLSPQRRQLTNSKNSAQIHRQIIGVGLMPNEKS
jgi:hypothetical protein